VGSIPTVATKPEKGGHKMNPEKFVENLQRYALYLQSLDLMRKPVTVPVPPEQVPRLATARLFVESYTQQYSAQA
jgi:hypothetical protein